MEIKRTCRKQPDLQQTTEAAGRWDLEGLGMFQLSLRGAATFLTGNSAASSVQPRLVGGTLHVRVTLHILR